MVFQASSGLLYIAFAVVLNVARGISTLGASSHDGPPAKIHLPPGNLVPGSFPSNELEADLFAEELKLAGYPVEINGLRSVEVNTAMEQLRRTKAPKFDGRPGSRVIIYDIESERRGLDDRINAITKWLSFATQAGAAFAFPTPNSSLSEGHGHSSAKWWTEYYVTVPPVYRFEDVACDPDATVFKITAFKDMSTWPARAKQALMNHSAPLCVRLQIGPDTQDEREHTSVLTLMDKGARLVNVWTSYKVAHVVQAVMKEVPAFRLSYNAAHVRLGDKLRRGGVLCSNTTYVVDHMQRTLSKYPVYGQSPWLLMSDGSADFFKEMKQQSHTHGFELISELDIKALTGLDDNFLRYCALECLWGASDVAVSTYKNLGGRCKMKPEHSGGSSLLACIPKEKE